MSSLRSFPLNLISELNDTHINILKALEESEADNYAEGVPGMSIVELADDLDRDSSTISQRVTELVEMGLVKKNKSEFSEKSVVIRPSSMYDVELGNRKIYMEENGVSL